MTGAGQGAPTISDEKLEALRWLTSAPGDFLVSQRDGHCIHFALVELRELRASHATLLLEVEGLKAALREAVQLRKALCEHSDESSPPEPPEAYDAPLKRWLAALSPASNTACATCGHEADHHSKDCGSDCHHAECYVTGCSCRRYVAALSPASGDNT